MSDMSCEASQEFDGAAHICSIYESEKHSKISYTREFLLSFRDLDTCKMLPTGYEMFDPCLVRENEDAFHGKSEWQRASDTSSFCTKRNEFDTCSLNHSFRESQGRWDVPSGSANKDSDSRSVQESDLLRPNGNASRRSWQNQRQDGLLGRGVFPSSSPSNIKGGTALRSQGNSCYQLKKSSEPYQPPHAYKGLSRSQKNEKDLLNDETFGTTECSSEDRVEEQKRRASFELMRKEQQRALQEKKRTNSEETQTGMNTDSDNVQDTKIVALLENYEADVPLTISSNSLYSDGEMTSQSYLIKNSLPLQAPILGRPLLPPGFVKAVFEKEKEDMVPPGQPEVKQIESESFIIPANDMKHISQLHDGLHESCNQEEMSRPLDKTDSSSGHAVSTCLQFDDIQTLEIDILKDTVGGWASNAVTVGADFSTGFNSEVNASRCASVLEQLFSNWQMVSNSELSSVECQSSMDKATSVPNLPSSMVTRWFMDARSVQTVVDPLSPKVSDLFSLLSGKDAINVSTVSQVDVAQQSLEVDPFQSKQEPSILTCEDLEQVILAEANKYDEYSANYIQTEAAADVDDHASHHLLSLLQKGAKDTPSNSHGDWETRPIVNANAEVEKVQGDMKKITLETLFGSAFVKELHSVGTPLSLQSVSMESKSEVPRDGWLELNNYPVSGTRSCSVMQEDIVDSLDFRLPEEENLINVGESVNRAAKAESLEFVTPDNLTGLHTATLCDRLGIPSFGAKLPFMHDHAHLPEQAFLKQHLDNISRVPQHFMSAVIPNADGFHPSLSYDAYHHHSHHGRSVFESSPCQPIYPHMRSNLPPYFQTMMGAAPSYVGGFFPPEPGSVHPFLPRPNVDGLILAGSPVGANNVLEPFSRHKMEMATNLKGRRLSVGNGHANGMFFSHELGYR